MKILFLASASSIHTTRWVNEMARRNHEVHLVSLHPICDPLDERIRFYRPPFPESVGYYANYPWVRRLAKTVNPDIINAHYASGYGTLARLVNFHPTILSIWGSDVYEFPYQSRWKKRILRKNLEAADRVASTSRIMRQQAENLFTPKKEIAITPFGVDCSVFRPQPKSPNNILRIGTVKTLSPKYGVSYLIEAFAIAKGEGLRSAELILVGDGPQRKELEEMTVKLDLRDSVKFIGPVPHAEVPNWLNSFHIYAALSVFDSESFGVSVVEASACGLPVVVSDAGGLPEVVLDGKTGFIVPKRDARSTAEKIVLLATDADQRNYMGREGRAYILKNYEWSENADRMERLYLETIDCRTPREGIDTAAPRSCDKSKGE